MLSNKPTNITIFNRMSRTSRTNKKYFELMSVERRSNLYKSILSFQLYPMGCNMKNIELYNEAMRTQAINIPVYLPSILPKLLNDDIIIDTKKKYIKYVKKTNGTTIINDLNEKNRHIKILLNEVLKSDIVYLILINKGYKPDDEYDRTTLIKEPVNKKRQRSIKSS